MGEKRKERKEEGGLGKLRREEREAGGEKVVIRLIIAGGIKMKGYAME